MLFRCSHCKREESFANRQAGLDAGWTLVEVHTAAGPKYGAFCPDDRRQAVDFTKAAIAPRKGKHGSQGD